MIMATQVKFYRKNRADLTNQDVVYTASQGQATISAAFDRRNLFGWQTTGSVDSDNPTVEVDFVDTRDIDTIFLLGMNFKSYTLQYWNGAAYVDFSPVISVSGNADDNKVHTFTEVSTSKVKLTVTSTIVTDADKLLKQFILTKALGQFSGWPEIRRPEVSRNRRTKDMLSGRANVNTNIGGFKCRMRVKHWSSQADLTLVETLYNANEGFLTWIAAGDESQFSTALEGNRFEDIYLMQCSNEYSPERVRGIYTNGVNLELKLEESIG